MKTTPPPDVDEASQVTPDMLAAIDWWMVAEVAPGESSMLAEVAIWWPKLREIRARHTC
jgi:hypothetical protein